MKTPPNFSRINGLQRPFHPLQILAWLVYIMKAISFYTLVAPALLYTSPALYIISQVTYAILLAVVAFYSFQATRAET